MRTNTFIVVFGYLRLSVDEVGKTVSGSIENQANIIRKYCAQHNLFLAELFQDDGWSGGNFERPGFKKMLAAPEKPFPEVSRTRQISSESIVRSIICFWLSFFRTMDGRAAILKDPDSKKCWQHWKRKKQTRSLL